MFCIGKGVKSGVRLCLTLLVISFVANAYAAKDNPNVISTFPAVNSSADAESFFANGNEVVWETKEALDPASVESAWKSGQVMVAMPKREYESDSMQIYSGLQDASNLQVFPIQLLLVFIPVIAVYVQNLHIASDNTERHYLRVRLANPPPKNVDIFAAVRDVNSADGNPIGKITDHFTFNKLFQPNYVNGMEVPPGDIRIHMISVVSEKYNPRIESASAMVTPLNGQISRSVPVTIQRKNGKPTRYQLLLKNVESSSKIVLTIVGITNDSNSSITQAFKYTTLAASAAEMPPIMCHPTNINVEQKTNNVGSEPLTIAYGCTESTSAAEAMQQVENMSVLVARYEESLLYYCSGVPISYDSGLQSTWVLTAGHCVVPKKATDLVTVKDLARPGLGMGDKSAIDSDAILNVLSNGLYVYNGSHPDTSNIGMVYDTDDYMVKAVYLLSTYCLGDEYKDHGGCSNYRATPGTARDDIALLLVNGKLGDPDMYPQITKTVPPLGSYILSSGYGVMEAGGLGGTLAYVTQNFISVYFKPGYYFLRNAEFYTDESNMNHMENLICSGDSGGGNFYYTESKWYLVGLNSFGEGLCMEKSHIIPKGSTYNSTTSVMQYNDWIESVMKNPTTVCSPKTKNTNCICLSNRNKKYAMPADSCAKQPNNHNLTSELSKYLN